MADNKKQTFLTGGGPPPNTKFDPTDKILIRILNEKTVKGLDVPFDSDSFEPVTKRQKQDVVFEFSPSPIESTRDHELLEENSNIEVIAVVNDNDSKLEEMDNRQSQNKKYPPLYLQSPMSTELKSQQSSSKSSGTPSSNSNTENPQPYTRTYKTTPKCDSSSSRRRPTNGIKILTSSDVSEKYNILLDRRLVLVEKQIKQVSQAENFAREEQKEKLKLMNQQQENLNLEKEEKKLKIKLLKLDLNYKRSLLSNI